MTFRAVLHRCSSPYWRFFSPSKQWLEKADCGCELSAKGLLKNRAQHSHMCQFRHGFDLRVGNHPRLALLQSKPREFKRVPPVPNNTLTHYCNTLLYELNL